MNNDWLEIAKRMQALAHNGLYFCENEYDRERYRELRDLSHSILERLGDLRTPELRAEALAETGYQTPKSDVRALVLRQEKILLVKEKADGRWSLPGGWADVGYSPAEVAVKEVFEETGLQVRALRLLAVLDKQKHEYPPSQFYTYKIFFLCEETGGTLQGGSETSEAAFFHLEELPPLSESRITSGQIRLMAGLAADPKAPAAFD